LKYIVTLRVDKKYYLCHELFGQIRQPHAGLHRWEGERKATGGGL
jgi:hypothetical protein